MDYPQNGGTLTGETVVWLLPFYGAKVDSTATARAAGAGATACYRRVRVLVRVVVLVLTEIMADVEPKKHPSRVVVAGVASLLQIAPQLPSVLAPQSLSTASQHA